MKGAEKHRCNALMWYQRLDRKIDGKKMLSFTRQPGYLLNKRSVAFRPHLTVGLAFSRNKVKGPSLEGTEDFVDKRL